MLVQRVGLWEIALEVASGDDEMYTVEQSLAMGERESCFAGVLYAMYV